MSGIQFFNNPEFGQIRMAGTPEAPLFCLADICKAIDLSNPSTVKSRLNREDVQLIDLHTLNSGEGRIGTNPMANFVTESGFYDVLFQSSSPKVRSFRKWVTSEVLPSIRRRGGYLTRDTIAKIIADPASSLELVQGLIEDSKNKQQKITMLEGENTILQEKVEVMEPKAQYTDDVLMANECFTFEQMSKELGFQSVYKFIDKLKSDNLVYKRSDTYMLFAKYSGKGLTATRTYRFYHRDGRPGTNTRTVFTQKGRQWLHGRYGQRDSDTAPIDLGIGCMAVP